MDSPATKSYLLALGFEIKKIRESIGGGGFIDSANNDLSMNSIHSALGSAAGLESASKMSELLNKYGLVEVEQ